jgi:peroxiredoxin Q/BCP
MLRLALVRSARTWTVALVAVGLVASVAAAAELKVGDKAPPFSLPGTDGKTYSLADFQGKRAVVLAWFPKAFTGGCTKECKSFRENSADLKNLKVAYFTASVDQPDYNKKFAESLDLDYPILSDPSKKVAEAYGVVHEGRPVPERWTFYIDKDGVIKAIDKGVQQRTQQAGADVVAKVKELGLTGE